MKNDLSCTKFKLTMSKNFDKSKLGKIFSQISVPFLSQHKFQNRIGNILTSRFKRVNILFLSI